MWEVPLFQLIRQIFTHKIIIFGKIGISIFCSFLKFVLNFETRIKKSCRKLPSVNRDAHFLAQIAMALEKVTFSYLFLKLVIFLENSPTKCDILVFNG